MTRTRRTLNKKVSPFNCQQSYNLMDALSPLYYGTKLMGLSPYGKVNNRYEMSLKGSFITSSIAIFLILNTIRVIGYYRDDTSNLIVTITVRFRVYLYFLSTLLVYVNEIKIQNTMAEWYREIQNIDNIFMSMGIIMPYKKFRRYSLISIVMLYTVCFTVASLDYIANWLFSCTQKTAYKAQFISLFVIPFLTQGAVTTNFCTLVMIIKQRFEILNNQVLRRILNMIDEKNDIIKKIQDRNSYFVRNNPSQIIAEAKIIHYELCKITRNINTMYAFPITCTILLSYCTLFVQIFFWFYVIVTNGVDFLGYMTIIHTFIVATFTTTCVILLAVMCDGCVSQGKQTAVELFRIDHAYKKPEITNIVRLFLLQVISMPTDITAAKLFVINRQLLMTMFSSTVTYSVILIQFDMAYKSRQ